MMKARSRESAGVDNVQGPLGHVGVGLVATLPIHTSDEKGR